MLRRLQRRDPNSREPLGYQCAHCGGSLQGEVINSLVSVDIARIWTEARAVFGKASGPIVGAIEDVEFNLPFALRGYDSDNGTEMLE